MLSPDPGEPGHERGSFTHAICDVDYFRLALQRNWALRPARVIDPDQGGRPATDRCCYCGAPTHGIYVRQAPSEVHPEGPPLS
jgi:hypothetical protein